MEIYRAVIEMKLPSLNEYIGACRANKYEAANLKRVTEAGIIPFLRRLPRFERPVIIHFRWIERDHRRDSDNIAAGKKFILDAMVKAGILKDDGRRYVKGFTDEFECGNKPMVIMDIEEL
jgi:hypothetical protein